ncbi:5'-adenylylsulfate reductase-like 7 [Prosopis cineraria]|uniref:5'-adenylylsulfate reductase-like 7 n=1 Tax=Prosopis cineraria TaxID=364024 RepID=UPI00240ED3A8|nr:5'-adenylylsulfate reductase-like 7 [Prosopis cineraria]
MASSRSMVPSLLLLFISALSLFQSASSSSAFSALCYPSSALFLYTIQSQCPRPILPKPPHQVDGNFVEGVLSGKKKIGFVSVLFYSSQCPFSHSLLPKFETLSSMFPQVEHLAIEQSSALPSIFSRYGIHSLPAILLVNQTSRLRYQGPKDLLSLKYFYERNTGIGPIQYFADDQQRSSWSEKKPTMKSLTFLSLEEITTREPYLALSTLFLCLRILFSVFSKIVSSVRALWVSYVPHLNLQIFGETSQAMGRFLHVIDVRRIWTKLRMCKARNFHVWASSLASVSLGESSSSARWSSQGLN